MSYTPPQSEPTFLLASMAPPRRKRTGLLIACIATGAVLLVGAAGAVGYAFAGKGDATPAGSATSAPSGASATTSAAGPSSAGPSSAGASSARGACGQLASFSSGIADDAYGYADLPPLTSIAEQAAASDSSSIAISGQLLVDTIQLAVAAKGQGDEAKQLESVKKYVRNLRKSCALAGFPT